MKANPEDKLFNVRSKPPLELLKLLVLFLLLGALLWVAEPHPPDIYIGVALVFVGEAIRVWAAGHLTRDQRLAVSGPYEYTRNPFYLGRFLLIVGFAIMAGIRNNMWVLGICVVALAIFFFYYMPRKDKREGGRLSELFGEQYDQWRANVPVLFPRLTPYRTIPRPWSRELFMTGDADFTGNKELWTALVVLALAAFLYWKMVAF